MTPVYEGKRSAAVALIVVVLALVTALDWMTAHYINFEIAYFVPIVYAAWAMGRRAAMIVAVVAEVPTVLEQIVLLNEGMQFLGGAVSTVVVRLLVYLFVAEVTTRLIKSREEVRSNAEKLHIAHKRLDDDARAGGRLQMSALEFAPPSVSGCEIGARVEYAEAVGGDFADAGVLNGKLFACVGDISGKGTPAALFTMLLKHVLRAAHRQGLRGVDVVSAVNLEICQSLPSDRFVTLFYTEIDPATGAVCYVSAGHPEGVAYRRRDGQVELIPPTGPLLGCYEIDAAMSESESSLAPGDVLVLYTDGATDSRMHSGVRLGDEVIQELAVLHAHLGAQEMADAIVKSIQEITREEGRDDIAVVCIKMTE